MNTINMHQRGVGLMEVLVALLVLAIGVLGFIVLQYRAVEATAESGYRVQAINIARDMAERIRVNRGAIDTYEDLLKGTAAEQIKDTTDCATTDCTISELAAYDVKQVSQKAQDMGMVMNQITCAGNEDGDKRSCIYVAWGDTAPTDGTDAGNCTSGTAYVTTSTCLIMEVY
ncbi:type IV pilus modification protein PilV [Acinetobacter sp. YH16044]|uniref:type IV pilus modification protein PilV n=1 Tax=Acinetobacter sp. YH16044 TaxID=2601187 RepID=UPI0015D25B12|nr:type IV pilus modification protein PilV [Acinetobacter sp. YH16044]